MESRVIFEIDATSVSGAIVSLSKEGQSEILFDVRESFGPEKKFDSQHLLISIKKCLEKVCAALLMKLGRKVSKIDCLLSSPYTASQNLSLRLEYREPVLITKELLNFLVEKEIKDFENQHLAGQDGLDHTSHALVEKKIQAVKLNGYPVSQPFGKMARRLEAHTYISIMPTILQAEIQEFLAPRFQLETHQVKFHSTFFCLFNLVRDIMEKESFILVRVGEEMTDLGLVLESSLVDMVSFPLGTNSLARLVAGNLGTLPEEGLTYLQGAGDNREGLLALEEWRALFQSNVQKFLEESLLPEECVLSAPDKVSDSFKSILEKGGSRVKQVSDILMVGFNQTFLCLSKSVNF